MKANVKAEDRPQGSSCDGDIASLKASEQNQKHKRILRFFALRKKEKLHGNEQTATTYIDVCYCCGIVHLMACL